MVYAIQSIDGISSHFAMKLRQLGVRTTEDLLAHGADWANRAVLSEGIGASPSQILRWCNQAELIRLSGINRQLTQLLAASGVDTVPELAERVAENLTFRIDELKQELERIANARDETMAGHNIDPTSRVESIPTRVESIPQC